MSGFLENLERQLTEAAESTTASRGRPRSPRHRIPASAAAALLALLVASAVALAVTGTFSTGSAVRPPRRQSGVPGAGIAGPGTHLLPMLAADPSGGLPWGMRIVHTTRRLVCLQVGRIDGTRLGVLGQDGAFGDDHRFHPVAPDVVGYHRETTELGNCLQPGQTTSLEARIPESGVFGSPHSEAIPATARRWISYGLLGPAAVSVTYRSAGKTRTIPVEPGSGAYLVVLPDLQKAGFETGGGASSASGLVTPQGAISSITYRLNGRTCEESTPAGEAAAAHAQCPHPLLSARPRATRRLGRPVRVRVSAAGTAIVTFTAPWAVSSAISDYVVEVPSPCHEGTSGTPVERDLRAGEVVHVTLPEVFANACGPTVQIRVVYEKDRNHFGLGQDEVIVGETSIRR